MRIRLRTLCGLALAALIAAAGACTREPAPAGDVEVTAPAGNDDANLDIWLERMEVGSRELYSARFDVVAAVGLKENQAIADIGAGTGLYTLLFAEAAGPGGRVYAEDIEPKFLDLINQRAEDAGVANITAVLGREHDVSLPTNSVDIVFIADTYHYFEDREAVMKSVFEALRPGGSLVIVDYDLQPGQSRPAGKEHVRFGKAGVISEIEYVGFDLAEEVSVPGLEDNYFLRFTRPEAPATAAE